MTKKTNSGKMIEEYLSPDFIKSIDSPEKADVYKSCIELKKQQMHNEHEEKMAKLYFEQEERAAGCFAWLGWKNPKLIFIVVLLFLLIMLAIISIMDYFQNENIKWLFEHVFDFIKVIISII